MDRPRTPLHERISLDESQLHLTGHEGGLALRFGPGPAVHTFTRDGTQAEQNLRWARLALQLLNKTLAQRTTQ